MQIKGFGLTPLSQEVALDNAAKNTLITAFSAIQVTYACSQTSCSRSLTLTTVSLRTSISSPSYHTSTFIWLVSY